MVAGFDRLLQRNDRIASMLKSQAKARQKKKSGSETESKTRDDSDSDGGSRVKKEPVENEEVNVKKETMDEMETDAISVDKAVAEMNMQLVDENRRLQKVASKLQEKNHALSVKVRRVRFGILAFD